MDRIEEMLNRLNRNLKEKKAQERITFEEFLTKLRENPRTLMRDIFQLVHDMVLFYVPPGTDEFPDDPESVHYKSYDFSRLFIRDSESPYFADRLFGNRLMNLIHTFDQVVDRNKIYMFEGPPGSGKSTFLNNFLHRFEAYMKTEKGEIYETTWKINKLLFPVISSREENSEKGKNQDYLLLNCPNHDSPILQIPRDQRKEFLYELIEDEEFKQKLFTEKKYEWIFKEEPCTICMSLYEALLEQTGSPLAVLNMIAPRRMRYSRRLGEGISVFNPGDILNQDTQSNPAAQAWLDEYFGDSNLVRIIHSEYARTNNGIYVVMDAKQHNKNRLLALHGVISDGIHKAESIEETIKSLYLGLMNPQDREFLEKNQALKDRINFIKMPYVLDYKTEVQIYTNIMGPRIRESFLPRILDNFARVIIASRLNSESPALKEWIGNRSKYSQFCDSQLLLLKMLIYAGVIPEWISEEDKRSFKAGIRRNILSEAENEGFQGITGRESIRLFHEFYTSYIKEDKMINMEMLQDFFTRNEELKKRIPSPFLPSLVDSYDYAILQEMKECLYYYNRSRISSDIQDYIFALNFETGGSEKSPYTGHIIQISREFLQSIEDYLIPGNPQEEFRQEFRREVQQKYISSTITEMKTENRKLSQTRLYRDLLKTYTRYLKSNALEPFKESDNFRSAIKEYNTRDFQSHDKKIRKDVTYLIHKLMNRYGYTENGAKEVCIYVIDRDIAAKFEE